MIPTQKEVLAYALAKIEEVKQYANTRFDLTLGRLVIDVNFKDTDRLGLAGRDRNNKPFIRLNLGKLIKYEVNAYAEYADLIRYHGVSSFYTTDWKIWLDALIAHEMAHVVQFDLPLSRSKLKLSLYRYNVLGTFEGGHGDFFRRIYRIIRNEFVNNYIDEAFHKVENFKMTAEEKQTYVDARRAKKASAMVQEHPLLGKKILFRKKIYTLTEVNTRSKKYPLVAYAACGARLNMPEDYVLKHGF